MEEDFQVYFDAQSLTIYRYAIVSYSAVFWVNCIITNCWGGTPHHLARGIFALQGRIEQRATLEHGAGDAEQPVSDGAECAAMAVATLAQSAVFEAAALIVLNGNPGQW